MTSNTENNFCRTCGCHFPPDDEDKACREWQECQKVQAPPSAEYAAKNPLGGPARVFESIASRIRAGEDYYEVLADYDLGHVKDIRLDECKRIMAALDAYPPASDYGPPIQERMAALAKGRTGEGNNG